MQRILQSRGWRVYRQNPHLSGRVVFTSSSNTTRAELSGFRNRPPAPPTRGSSAPQTLASDISITPRFLIPRVGPRTQRRPRSSMSNTKLALILAAGNGSRLAARSGELPKPLVQVHGKPLLEHVMRGAQEAGIERFVIVLGYRGHMIQHWYESHPIDGVQVTWVENPDYHKNNGVSVLRAKPVIHEPSLLMMADHMFDPANARALLRHPLGKEQVFLAVDRNIDRVFDIEHAIDVAIHGEKDLFLSQRVTQEGPRIGRIKHVVCHHQQGGFVNHGLGAQDGHAVVLVVVRIFHPGDLNAVNRVAFVPVLNHVAAITEDDDKPLDSGLLGTAHDVLQQGFAVHLYQRLGKFPRASCQSAAITSGENQRKLSVRHT